jgi:hypothetical protein
LAGWPVHTAVFAHANLFLLLMPILSEGRQRTFYQVVFEIKMGFARFKMLKMEDYLTYACGVNEIFLTLTKKSEGGSIILLTDLL